MSVIINNPETVEEVAISVASTLAVLAVPVLTLLASF
jgi:hypothetical protein